MSLRKGGQKNVEKVSKKCQKSVHVLFEWPLLFDARKNSYEKHFFYMKNIFVRKESKLLVSKM